MTFWDKIVTGFIIAFSMLVIIFQGFFIKGESGERVEITVDGQLYGSYALKDSKTLKIDTEFGSNTLEIKNGCAWVSEADCPDKLDIKMGKISKTNQRIICLPNRLMIEITGSDGKVDRVTY